LTRVSKSSGLRALFSRTRIGNDTLGKVEQENICIYILV